MPGIEKTLVENPDICQRTRLKHPFGKQMELNNFYRSQPVGLGLHALNLYRKEKSMRGLKLTVYTLVVGLSLGICITPASAQDIEGSRDHPLFTRLPNCYIDSYEEKEFDAYVGFVDNDGSYKTVEGRKFHINYHFKDGTKYLSDAQIKGNYREAFKNFSNVNVHPQTANNICLENGKIMMGCPLKFCLSRS